DVSRLGGLCFCGAGVAETAIGLSCACHRRGYAACALRRVRAHVPGVAAARRARRRVRFLKGRAMENLQSLLHGFTIAVTVPHLALMVIGALFGGSVTSILFNIPGEPSSVATTFDGYPMARDGRPTTALATAFGSAAFGALIGVILITFLASWVAQVARAFGPAEYFAVYFLAFASFVGMGGAAPIKTVVALMIGFAIAAIGIDTVSGSVRLTMGVDELVKGVS